MLKPKRKLLVVTNLYPLPWEPNRATFNRQQFEHLKMSFDVKVLVPIAWPQYLKHARLISSLPDDEVKYVPYFYLPKVGRRFNADFMYHSIRTFADKWIKSFAPHKMLASWAYPEGLAVKRLAKHYRCPYSVKVHGSDINAHLDNPVRSQLIKKALGSALSVICVSFDLKQKLTHLGVSEQKIRVAYNGLDRSVFKPAPSDAPLKKRDSILFVGNLKESKGVLELIKSFAIISSYHKSISLKIAGTGSEKQAMIELAKEYEIDHKVHFLGSVNHKELPELMRKARVLILPSHGEGVPNVVLESICCGTPVVATQVGGIPEVVTNGVNGFLCTAKDVNSLNQATFKALSANWSKQSIIDSAAKFDWQKNRITVSAALNCIDIHEQQELDKLDAISDSAYSKEKVA